MVVSILKDAGEDGTYARNQRIRSSAIASLLPNCGLRRVTGAVKKTERSPSKCLNFRFKGVSPVPARRKSSDVPAEGPVSKDNRGERI